MVKYTAPSRWADFLMEDDVSNMTKQDIIDCYDWVMSRSRTFPVSSIGIGFQESHDAIEYTMVAEECHQYTFDTSTEDLY
jgi:hypothetical protein